MNSGNGRAFLPGEYQEAKAAAPPTPRDATLIEPLQLWWVADSERTRLRDDGKETLTQQDAFGHFIFISFFDIFEEAERPRNGMSSLNEVTTYASLNRNW